MKQKFLLAVILLLDSNAAIKLRDWDDLLTNNSVFNSQSYESDMPVGYGDVVNEVVTEHDSLVKKRR